MKFFLNPKLLNQIHIFVGGIVSVLAFYFLGQGEIVGWVFQSIAGILYTFYYLRQKLPILATVILGAEAILPLYGVYKWSQSLNEFTFIDSFILGITFIFVLYMAYKMFHKQKEKFFSILIEFVNSVLYIIAALLLATTQSVFAWIIFLIVFSITLGLVAIKKEWIAVMFQLIYISLAIFAISQTVLS